MRKEDWLLQEIDNWQGEGIINAETATLLQQRYNRARSFSSITVIFAIIGALLIGSGVILIMARNWDNFALPLRISLAYLPLLAAQALAVYTVRHHFASLAWREASGILLTAGVFTVIAMVGQIFHLSADLGRYLLICGLLSLPGIYLLDAATPLAVYFGAVISWASMSYESVNVLLLLFFLTLGFIYSFRQQGSGGTRLSYIAWSSVLAGLALVPLLSSTLRCSIEAMLLCFLALLLAGSEIKAYLRVSCQGVATLGGFITLAVLSYENSWQYGYDLNSWQSPVGTVIIALLAVAALFLTVKRLPLKSLTTLQVACYLLLATLSYIWSSMPYLERSGAWLLAAVANLALLTIGVGYLVSGVRGLFLRQTNIGMAYICLLIFMRFFDSELDFLWRGIVFLLLGTTFLLINLRLVRLRKETLLEDNL
ncbi:MAG: DUF2157 domain-containing protein [Symbiobacteriaceae bacterium]|nr:DUF2157 domain-containing protein [Symbiobacteriaceae bacterium]